MTSLAHSFLIVRFHNVQLYPVRNVSCLVGHISMNEQSFTNKTAATLFRDKMRNAGFTAYSIRISYDSFLVRFWKDSSHSASYKSE
jgi:hypothetical protein